MIINKNKNAKKRKKRINKNKNAKKRKKRINKNKNAKKRKNLYVMCYSIILEFSNVMSF